MWFFKLTEDIDYQSDCIPTKTLIQLTNDIAKLKAKGCIDAINKSKLTLLINFAMRNVDVAKSLVAGPVSRPPNGEKIPKKKVCILSEFSITGS